MAMSMTLKFRTLAQFLFMEQVLIYFSWQSNDTLGLLLGCFCCMVLSFIMLAMPEIRRRALKALQSSTSSQASVLTDLAYKSMNEKEMNLAQKIASVFIYIVHAFLHVVIMVIIMNMNFYVILFIVIGATLGFLTTSDEYCAKKNDHACCSTKKDQKKGYDSIEQCRELIQELDSGR